MGASSLNLGQAGRLLIGWHRLGRSHACVNPRFKERRLVWRAGDVLLVAIDPEIRTGSMMHRANAIAQYKNQEAAKKTFELTFVTAGSQAPVESSKGSVSTDAEPKLPLHRTTTLDQKPPVEGDRGKTTPKTTPRTSADDVNTTPKTTPRSSHESATGKPPGPRVRPKSPAKKKGSGSKGNAEEGSKF
jgi:hypothetical protein